MILGSSLAKFIKILNKTFGPTITLLGISHTNIFTCVPKDFYTNIFMLMSVTKTNV